MWTLFRQALTLLNQSERRHIYGLLALSAVAAIIQTAAILSMMPFIVLLANPAILESNQVLMRIYEAVGADSYTEFLTYFGIFGILILSIGNLILAVEHWASSRFLCMLGHRMEKLILERMLQQPYEYFLAHNSARLSDIVLNQVERVVDGVVGRFIVVFSNVALAAFIVVMLLVVSLQTTLITLAGLVALYLAVFLLLRRRITEHGQALTRLSGDLLTAVRETFDGIKEIKTRRAEAHFTSRFAKPSLQMSQLALRYSILSFLPHFLLETLVFAGLVAVALYFIMATQSPGLTLSLIALYGIATYRLVPSLKSIFEGISDMQHNEDALRIVLEHCHISRSRSGAAARDVDRPRREIRIERLTYAFGGQEQAFLQDIDLVIPAGSSICLFGPSGSGKSTLLNVIAGLIRPAQGRVLCDDTAISDETIAGWRRHLGYCPQRVFLFDDTIASNIAFGVPADEIDRDRVVEVAGIAMLDDFVSRHLDAGYDTNVGEHGKTISGGQAQRIGIARALYPRPSVLILDESFNGLDVANRDAILDNLFALPEMTLVFASHEPEIAARCDAVASIDRGRLP